LDKLNELFQIWVEECYQNRPHSALNSGNTPLTAYRSDKKPQKFLDPDVITNAFLHCEQRKVDKAGCISFESKKYEVGISFIGCTVDVVFDPADTNELTIEYAGHSPWKAKQLVIGERVGKRPKLPEHLTKVGTDSSRLLKAAAKKNQQRREQQAPAISFRSVIKAGE